TKSCVRAAMLAMHGPSVPEINMQVWIGDSRSASTSQKLFACLVRCLAAVGRTTFRTRNSGQCRECLGYVPLGGRGHQRDERNKHREPSKQYDEEYLHSGQNGLRGAERPPPTATPVQDTL